MDSENGNTFPLVKPVGVEEVNFDLYPDETFQKRWIRIYLEERAKMTGYLQCHTPLSVVLATPPLVLFFSGEAVDNDSIHCLYKEVDIFQLVSRKHFTSKGGRGRGTKGRGELK